MIVTLALALLAIQPPGTFTIELPVRPDSEEGQRLIVQRALETCAGQYPQLGRYRFSGQEQVVAVRPGGPLAPPLFRVEVELTCLAAPPPPPPLPPQVPAIPSGWQPGVEDEHSVMAATRRYFALFDSGDAAGVHALWVEGEQENVPVAQRTAAVEAFRAQAGAPGEHRIARLTWYVNPQSAPRPGIYVAADYERSYAGLHFNCGYVVWYREAPDRYRLVREETAIAARDDRSVAPEQLAELRSQMRCPAR